MEGTCRAGRMKGVCVPVCHVSVHVCTCIGKGEGAGLGWGEPSSTGFLGWG